MSAISSGGRRRSSTGGTTSRGNGPGMSSIARGSGEGHSGKMRRMAVPIAGARFGRPCRAGRQLGLRCGWSGWRSLRCAAPLAQPSRSGSRPVGAIWRTPRASPSFIHGDTAWSLIAQLTRGGGRALSQGPRARAASTRCWSRSSSTSFASQCAGQRLWRPALPGARRLRDAERGIFRPCRSGSCGARRSSASLFC